MRWLESTEHVTSEASFERKETAPRALPQGQQVRTPDNIIADLEQVDRMLNRSVRLLRDADDIRASAESALRRAQAKARLEVKGERATVAEKDALVAQKVEAEQSAFDVAEIAYRYARDTGRWLEGRKSSLQTESKLVLATYQVASYRP